MSAILFQASFGPRSESPSGMRHPNFPLVVQVRTLASATEPAPFSIPLEQLDIGKKADLVCETVTRGLNVYAANETAARAAVAALHARQDQPFDLFGPDVRYWPGPPVREPVMSVDLHLPLVFGAFVRREILRRRGRIHATEPGRQVVTLRGEAPLAALLGFGRWLGALTDGRGQFRTALLRYAPIGGGSDPEPGPLAA